MSTLSFMMLMRKIIREKSYSIGHRIDRHFFLAFTSQVNENAELTAICDELINKMGGQRS